MLKFQLGLIGLIGLFASCQFGSSSDGAEEARPVMHRIQAGEPEADQWFTAKSTEGNFTVRLPARFNDFTVLSNKDGTEKRFHVLGCVQPGKVKFSAVRGLKLNPKADADSILDEFGKTFEKKGMLKSKKKHQCAGYPAMDAHIEGNGAHAYMRQIILPKESIMMIVDQQGSGKIVEADVEKFFASLKIDKPE